MKSFLVIVMAVMMLLELGLVPAAQAQQKQTDYESVFRKYDDALVKMIAVMHLRKEANDLRREKINWAKGQVKQLYDLDLRNRFVTDKEKAEVAKAIDALERNFDSEHLPAVYSDEIFPLLVARLRGQEIANPSALQKRMLAEMADRQSDGGKWFVLTRAVNAILNREYEAINAAQDDLESRILLFEALFKKKK